MNFRLLAVAALAATTACGPGTVERPRAQGPAVSTPQAPALPTVMPTRPPTASPTASPVAPKPALPTTLPTPPPTRAPTPAPTSAQPSSRPGLRAGAKGADVLAIQRRLALLHYWLGEPDGTFGTHTRQAVLALQGAAGLPRDGIVGPRTRAALDKGVQPQVQATGGHATEIDRGRGLLVFSDHGVLVSVLHTSTGTFKKYYYHGQPALADTPAGSFTVDWSVDGWRDGALGRLYRPRYFHPDGIAVHGYPIVPAYPASHGCARVSLAAMDMVWERGLMPTGGTVLVR
jgi:N-acetylmuramoyl-L-alanine amidase